MKMCRRAGGVWLAAGLAAISLARAELQTPPAQKTPAAGMDALLTGRDLLNQGRWMDAVRFYRMALKTTPESSEVRFGLATALTQIERYAEAVPLLESLLREYPDNPAVLNNLAWILAKAEDAVLRDPPRALRLARDAVLAGTSDFNIWNTLAEAYLANRQPARALRIARVALGLARADGSVRDTAPLHNLLQRCAKAAGEPVEAPDINE